jgi:hypothetical protein
MNRELVRFFYLAAFVTITWWMLVSVLGRFKNRFEKPGARIACAAVAVIVSFLPIGGLPLWQSVYGVWTNPSIPLFAMVAASLAHRVFGVTLLPATERRAVWIFGGVVGTLLYFHPTVFRGLDLYYLGWDRRGSVIVLGVAAIVLLALGKRVGVLFFAAFVAFALGVLESGNCWDYVIDPFYWLISLGVGAKGAIAWWQKQRQPVAVTGAPVVLPTAPTSVGRE